MPPGRPPRASGPKLLSKGDRVRAKFQGGDTEYEGVIAGINPDGTYNVVYDDWDKENGIQRKMITRLGGGSARGSGSRDNQISRPGRQKSLSLQKGSKVMARYRGD